jgi:hypothetical protein
MNQTDALKKQAYPLQWPPSRQRSKLRKTHTGFKTSFAKARDECLAEIKRLGGSDAIVSTNIELKRDGNPKGVEWNKHLPDPGVAVYFKRNGRELCFACDCWNHAQDNMHAISLTISALRGIARWGTGDMMEAAFRGFAALPEKTGGITWWTVLGTAHNATEEQVSDAYRALSKQFHPDVPNTGNAEKWMEIRQAYDQAQALFRRN